MNISELLARQSRKYPNKEAIVSGGDRITYKENASGKLLKQQLRELQEA